MKKIHLVITALALIAAAPAAEAFEPPQVPAPSEISAQEGPDVNIYLGQVLYFGWNNEAEQAAEAVSLKFKAAGYAVQEIVFFEKPLPAPCVFGEKGFKILYAAGPGGSLHSTSTLRKFDFPGRGEAEEAAAAAGRELEAAGYVVLDTAIGSTMVFDRSDWAFSIAYIAPSLREK